MPPVQALIEPARVHGSLYTDPTIYATELERIWFGGWVYVGHESEVPAPGDRLPKPLGPTEVLLVRREDGQVDVERVARVASHRGFVFGSHAAEGITLAEHLGDAAATLDRVARLSPTGAVQLTCGWLQHEVRANWKMVVENETDGYHPKFVHASIFDIAPGPLTDLFGDKSAARARDLGGGHTELLLTEQFRRGGTLSWAGSRPERMPEYLGSMADAHGREEAERIVTDGPPHVMIFPNLFIAEIQLFVIQPVGVDRTIQHVTALQYEGGAELNRKLLQNTIGSVGPAGLLLADDAEMYERNMRGVRTLQPEWLDLRRGIERETVDPDGHPAGHVTDEVTQRGMWRHYLELMA